MVITRRQIELETFLLISIVVVGSLYFAIQKNNHQPQFSFASGISPVSAPAEIISPKITVAQQISPDGEKKVIMKVTENSDNTKTHDLSTADENGANEKFVFTKILDSSKSMSIPFNTWSPDDKYFFIQENAGENKSIFVFKATGESLFPIGSKFPVRQSSNSPPNSNCLPLIISYSILFKVLYSALQKGR
ncbi:MAG: hypothetical protein US59_C0008G0024 [Candidatus Levybacteria bacterium GW2011_GWB1_37_8]|nr:MAG: hypothetical protein US59_C0008G0024 [Candidatus Levybacteria bacterium GW2011_GWB1_37_8]